MKCVVFTVSEAIVTRSIENYIGMYIHQIEFRLYPHCTGTGTFSSA